MSNDLAVWEGDAPEDAEAASRMFRQLYGRYIESDQTQPPTPRIAAYAAALLDPCPDIDTEEGDNSPWSSAPLLGEAVGPLMYFPMVWSRCQEVPAWAAQLAHEHRLVCYDPQLDRLRPVSRSAGTQCGRPGCALGVVLRRSVRAEPTMV